MLYFADLQINFTEFCCVFSGSCAAFPCDSSSVYITVVFPELNFLEDNPGTQEKTMKVMKSK